MRLRPRRGSGLSSESMRRVLQLSVVFTLMLALGGHWACLQTIAWIGMTVQYSRGASLGAAVEKTLSGRHPCKLCRAVAAGQNEERQQAAEKGETKLEFPAELEAGQLFPLLLQPLERISPPLPLARAQPPPIPPPRGPHLSVQGSA